MSTNSTYSDSHFAESNWGTTEENPSIVPCRVCGSMIDIMNKKDQHVVKCEYCNEATVSITICYAYYINI